MSNATKSISQIVESINLSKPETLQRALQEAIGDNGIKAGSKCGVLDDPTWPYAGQVGDVVSVDESHGVAKVKFQNGTEVNLQLNLLFPA